MLGRSAVAAASSPASVPAARSGAIPLAKLSLSVATDVGKRLRYAAVDHNVSESVLVEVALRELFARGEDEIGAALRQHGASRWRKSA